MDAEGYQVLLEKYDDPDPEHAEYPPDFDWRDARIRFRTFLGELEKELASSLWVDEGPQDASFHSEVFLPSRVDCRISERSVGTAHIVGTGRIVGVSLRFSNFGDLVALDDEEENISPETLELVKALLARHSYTYIPHSAWEGPYTGKNPSFAEKVWWDRYFDYA